LITTSGKGVLERGEASLTQLIPPLLIKERGIKRVPRKIEDFSGCLKGVRLIIKLVKIAL